MSLVESLDMFVQKTKTNHKVLVKSKETALRCKIALNAGKHFCYVN